MTEEQFIILEDFCSHYVRRHERMISFQAYNAGFVLTKDFVRGFRIRLGISQAITTTLFSGSEEERRKASLTLHFYNLVKKIVIRSGSTTTEKAINIRVFNNLVREIRTKLDIYKAGIGPQKPMTAASLGLDLTSKSKTSKDHKKR